MEEKDMPAIPVEGLREKVAVMEKLLTTMPQTAMLSRAHFAPGLFAKELHIPAGTVIVGKVHLAGHLNFLMEGEITVFNGKGMLRLKAPCILESSPGVKRVGFTHSNTVWVTVHAIERQGGQTPEELEDELTVRTMDDYDEFIKLTGGQEFLSGGEL